MRADNPSAAVVNEICEIIRDQAVVKRHEDGTNLRDELGLDSVDVVSIVSQIERRFRIRLTHQELEKLVTLADVLNLLETKLGPAPSQNAA